MRFLLALSLACLAFTGVAQAASLPTLEGRALLAGDATASGPYTAAPNTDPVYDRKGSQPVGGFSALIDAPGQNRYYAMPDNGFGTKANSRAFLLRIYDVRVDFKTRKGGSGKADVRRAITLSDPDKRVLFRLVLDGTRERYLTGADFDIESVRIDAEGDFWFGEEFGPSLLHTDKKGRLKEAPIPLPGARSPDAPNPGGEPNLASSNGIEPMAISPDGKTLYPGLEGPVKGDDPKVRRIYEFDIASRKFKPGFTKYPVAKSEYLFADLMMMPDGKFVGLERDNLEGKAARHKQFFEFDRDGSNKKQLADLLDLADPAGISEPGRPGDTGIGEQFSMPYVTIESILPVGPNRFAIVNDTNFGSRGRNSEIADDSDFIVVGVPKLKRDERTFALFGDTPVDANTEAAFPRLTDSINADPDVSSVIFTGDIKGGVESCSDELLERRKALTDGLKDRLFYTPGDNEWADCHRKAAGSFDPIERLGKVRSLFHEKASTEGVAVQAAPFVENRRWHDGRISFATVNVAGSRNGSVAWTDETAEQRDRREADLKAREKAATEWIDDAFDMAAKKRSRGLVIAMHAYTSYPDGSGGAFDALNAQLQRRAAQFGRPVLLLQGDRHGYEVSRPYKKAPNLTRIVVSGDSSSEWIRVSTDPRSAEVFSWRRIQLKRPLSVSSYNIKHGVGNDGVLALERTAKEIERGGAKVIGLQEVDRNWGERSDFEDQAKWLAERLKMNVVYGANLDEGPPSEGKPRRRYGTAILSSYAIRASKNTPLPWREGTERRGLLEADVFIDGAAVKVYNTHLQHTYDARDLRRDQAQAIVDSAKNVEAPIILTGDLNDTPESPALAPLTERFSDVWPRVGEGNGYTSPSSPVPTKRIDYIQTTRDIDAVGAKVLNSQASDHAQVVADLELPAKR